MQLTEKVLCYQAGHWSWLDLWGQLNSTVNQFLQQRQPDPDFQARFMLRFEPRILSMVETFQYRGIPFEALIRRAMHHHLQNIYREQSNERKLQQLSLADQTGFCLPEQVFDDTPEYQGEVDHGARNLNTLSVKNRRLLIAAFKNCLALDETRCRQLAARMQLSLNWLRECRDQICQTLEFRRELKRQLTERLQQLQNDHYCRGEMDERNNPTKFYHRLDRIDKLQNRLSTMQLHPRHHHIAKILGIPKGTVDSALFYVRAMSKVAD